MTENQKLIIMANKFSKKMGEARKAWKLLIEHPTVENHKELKAKMNAAGASHINFSEMEVPMPKEFACEYIHKIPNDLERQLKKDFGPGGKFFSLRQRQSTGQLSEMRA